MRSGRPLSGAVSVSGAKNSALKLLAAALLAEGTSRITNVPDIADIGAMAAVCEHLGAGVRRDHDALTIDVPGELGTATPPELVRRLRASIVVLGPLVARMGYAHLAQPGGCNLGHRGIDMHLRGLEALGAEVAIGEEHVEVRADRLVGADVELPFPSVGATENLLLAAVTAKGVTRIGNAAREPEIVDLVAFLQGLGAVIEGEGTSEIEVVGVGRLRPTQHAVVGDRIEAGTYAAAAALAGGEVKIDGVDPVHLGLPLDKLRAIGVGVDAGEDHLVVRGPWGSPRSTLALGATDVVTLPFPGVPTDLQAAFLTLLTQAGGTSMVTENVFDGRFVIVDELRRMGASIDVEGHHALVHGPRHLHGAVVTAPDLRAGAALVLAGLVAEGETTVVGAHHVDRGYSDFAGRLRSLGADVDRLQVADGVVATR